MCLLRSLWLKRLVNVVSATWSFLENTKFSVECLFALAAIQLRRRFIQDSFLPKVATLNIFQKKNIYRFSISSIVCEKQSWKEFIIFNEKNKTFSGTFFLRVEDKSRKVESLMTSSSVIRDKKVPSFKANLTKIQQKKRWIIMSVPCVCESVCVCVWIGVSVWVCLQVFGSPKTSRSVFLVGD